MTRHIGVIDVGKTNAKLALVDAATWTEIGVVTRPNAVLPGPPWPHFDLDGHWRFFLHHLGRFHAEHGVDAISVTTHGASAVLLDAQGELAAPMLDYEYSGPDELAGAYDAIRPAFTETGSARLPMGLNLGAQLHWLFHTQPDLADRVAQILTYPQYWGYRLTGERATDVTSLGCHTDLWNPWQGRFSSLVDRLGLAGRIPVARRPGAILGHLRPDVAAATGLSPDTPVACGIHDSNASLYPYVMGMQAPFAVVSTGTWVVAMAVGGRDAVLDPARDVLVNVNACGDAVPSARFMGGREFDMIRGTDAAPPDEGDRRAVLDGGVMILPAVEPASGPFPGCVMSWTSDPQTAGQRMAALSWYLALMTATCLDLIGAAGPVIVEGPFARNGDYLAMLTAICPGGVRVASSATGTSVGAGMLLLDRPHAPQTVAIPPSNEADALRHYAAVWRARVQRHCGGASASA